MWDEKQTGKPDVANVVGHWKNEVMLMATPMNIRSKNYYDSLSKDEDEEEMETEFELDIMEEEEENTKEVVLKGKRTGKKKNDPDGYFAYVEKSYSNSPDTQNKRITRNMEIMLNLKSPPESSERIERLTKRVTPRVTPKPIQGKI